MTQEEHFAQLFKLVELVSNQLDGLMNAVDDVDRMLVLQGSRRTASKYLAMACEIQGWRDSLTEFNYEVVAKQAMIRLSLLRIIKLGCFCPFPYHYISVCSSSVFTLT